MNKRGFLTGLIVGVLAFGQAMGEDLVKAKDGAVHVDAAQAQVLLKKGVGEPRMKIKVIDVRTPGEFSEGHLKGAKNIDFRGDGFKAGIAKLDRDKAYLVHCRSGGRSSSSLAVFKELGFKHIYHLDGGMLGWEKAGNAIERPAKSD